MAASRRSRWLWSTLLLVALVGLLVALVDLGPYAGPTELDEADGPWPYVAVFALVFGDGVVPVLPGETTLNAAGTLAAQGILTLGWVAVAGAAGAVLGDSALYWIARRSRTRVQAQLDTLMRNGKVVTATQVIGSSAAALLVFGRYVPGLRFVVNASLGLSEHPYRDFLRWSAVGGTAWSIYICGIAYAVGSVLADAPIAAIAVSAVASSVAVVVVFFIVARRLRRLRRLGNEPATGAHTG